VRAITAAGLGAIGAGGGGGGGGSLAADYLGWLSIGQSTAVGGASTASGASQPYSNVKLSDSIVASATNGWIWSRLTTYAGPSIVYPNVKNGFHYLTSSGGVSGSAEPTWPTTVGGTVSDGSVTWTAVVDAAYPYDVTNPASSTLSFASLVTPTRYVQVNGNANDYPTNILGQSQGFAGTAEACALAIIANTPTPTFVLHDVAVGGTSLVNIDKGGGTKSYAAALNEIKNAKHLANAISKTYALDCFVFSHGEADGGTDGAYQSGVITYNESHLQVDLKAVTGQTATIPLLLTQQTSSPVWGPSGAPPFSAAAQLRLATRTGYALACTSYQYPYTGGFGQHLTAQGYDLRGEKIGQVRDVFVRQGGSWTIPRPTSFSASSGSTSVVVTFAVQSGMTPLQFRTTDLLGSANSGPHQTGTLSTVWSAAKGFEASILTGIAITGATNASPIVLTTAVPHGIPAGTVIQIVDVGGNTAANGNYGVSSVTSTTITLNNTAGNGAFTSGGFILLPVIGATNVAGIVITTPIAHGLSTGDVVTIGGVRGNTAANGHFVVTVLTSTTFQLNGSTGNGAYTIGGAITKQIKIDSVAVQSGNQVAITLHAAPGTGLAIGYAWTPDDVTINAGGMGTGCRYGMLSDSDTFVGRSGTAQPNFAAIFQQRSLT
jgi:hypothetical protein